MQKCPHGYLAMIWKCAVALRRPITGSRRRRDEMVVLLWRRLSLWIINYKNGVRSDWLKGCRWQGDAILLTNDRNLLPEWHGSWIITKWCNWKVIKERHHGLINIHETRLRHSGNRKFAVRSACDELNREEGGGGGESNPVWAGFCFGRALTSSYTVWIFNRAQVTVSPVFQR